MLYSPLRYPGGKAKLFSFFAGLINDNSLFGAEYCEAYAGGAGLAIQLLSHGYVERVSINDIDRTIYAFWISALRDTDRFCKLIEKTPITIAEWHKQKKIWAKGRSRDTLQLGFATYFLNRTNRSGIIDGAGPIGGFDQTGAWKIDARLVREKQIDNLMSLSKFSKQIDVTNVDALKFFRAKATKSGSLTYLDPPYFVKGRKLYTNFYEPDDHQLIAEAMNRHKKLNWVVSYDDVPQIRSIYKKFKPITYRLNYSANEKSVGTEVIFLSDALTPPSISGFKIAA